MITFRRMLLTVAGLLILCSPAASMHGLGTQRGLSQFGQQSWRSDSGLPQNTVHSVLQTRDGFLWIATEGGLVRFDGQSFRVYDAENTSAIRSDIINDLKEDGSGTLWASTSAGLLRAKAGAFTLFTVANGLPSNSVAESFVPRGGGLLVVTSAGLAVLRGDRFEKIAGTEDLQVVEGRSNIAEADGGQIWVAGSREIWAVRADGSGLARSPVGAEIGEVRALCVGRGEVWVGGRSGLKMIRGAAAVRLTTREGLPSDDVRALLADGAGGMWIGTSRGLARWSGGKILGIGEGGGLADTAVDRLFLDREGAVWAVTKRGVTRIVEGRVDMTARRSRLTGVLSVFEDREGSMWFGTDNAGLTVLREQAFSATSEEDGLTAGTVRAIFQDAAGTIWIGTDGGGLDRLDHGRVSPAVSHPALSSDVVLSIAQTGPDLWIGTPNGLNRLRNGVLKVFTTQDGLPDDFVRSLYADRDGSLWIGTRNGLSHMAAGGFISFSRMDGLGSDLIGAMLRTRRGDLWIGTLGGLSRWKGDGFVNVTTRDGLGSDAVTTLLEDGEGTLWIGTQGAGLTRLREGRFEALSVARTGIPETVFGLLEDSAGDLWMSSRRGVYRISTRSLDTYAEKGTAAISGTTYGVADGMRISEGSGGGHPAAWRMRDGSLWFATLDGAAFVSPESIAKNRLTPETAIEQVLLNDHAINAATFAAGQALVVPPGARRMEVRYAGLSFVAPQKVRYRYKLDGFDKDWVEAGTRREAFYTNVPPGKYRFLVLSSNNDGVWSSAPSGFDMTVRPTLLQTRWFYALLAICLAGLVFAAYRWRVHSVEAQYKAVLQERGRIAREIHDTLAQGYVAISLQLEVTARLLQTSQQAALKQLDETKELVRGSLAEARSSIWNLRSQTDPGTLPSLLAAMQESRSTVDGPALKLEVKGTYRPLSSEVEKEILRIAQEAVTNAVRHASAEHIDIILRYDASTVRLQVIDDGRGFAEDRATLAAHGHFGLQGMRERATRISAKLKLQSAPGKGTVVELQINPRKAEGEDRL